MFVSLFNLLMLGVRRKSTYNEAMSEKFTELEAAPQDPIMQANAEWPAFAREHPDAINTTIGVIIDPDAGKPWRPLTVQRALEHAATKIVEDQLYGYQPPAGSEDLLFGVKTMYDVTGTSESLAYQALGGTGALQLTKEALTSLLTGPKELLLDPGWPNHQRIFETDFDIKTYQHADYETGTYNHQAALDMLAEASDGATVLLQGHGYNDDGLDRTDQQWEDVLSAAVEKEMTVILDMAYVGLKNSYYSDFSPVWRAADKGLLTFANLSFSKNMGLYNERVGALLVVNADTVLGTQQASRFDQAVKRIIRRTVSSPPQLAAMAAGSMLQYGGFHDELIDVRNRLVANRTLLAETLPTFPIISNGSGLFTKLLPKGYTDTQYAYLQGAGIHALKNSRLNLGGIRLDQVERVGQTILQALEV